MSISTTSNDFYAVNAIPFHYQLHPIQIKVGEKVRIYLVNILEFDLINSFHLHANFFHYYPTGTSLTPSEFTDTIMQTQAQRGILEFSYKYPGQYMFHAHNTEFAELGWTGFLKSMSMRRRAMTETPDLPSKTRMVNLTTAGAADPAAVVAGRCDLAVPEHRRRA